MESFLEEVKKYDDVTLRQKLNESGIPVGPITSGTKQVLQKRLAIRQFEQKTGCTFNTADASNEKTTDAEVPVERKGSDGDVFYAICLPEDAEHEVSQEVTQLVFSDKISVLKAVKKVKGSRFKAFKSESDAEKFSRLTSESAFQSPKKLPKEEVQVASESSPYRGPRPQDVFVLRRAIERGDVPAFKECIWQNPRYLISSGDTPVMFQEGPRYTAMHVSAIKNKPEICRLILDTLEDPEFVNKLYCNSNITEETQNKRINFLVDLYLNMPDKGNCESPLHMACKFGNDAVVEVLAAHPKTDKTLRNKYGETPKDLICSRVPNSPLTLKKKIEDLLKGQYYVPLIRSEDNSVPPLIGQPWSPDVTKSPLDLPNMAWSPKDPNISIKACAGPMSPDDANRFHKRWTTPPSKSFDKNREYINTKRSDCEKGMERIGRKLAHDLNLPWKEYWEFLQDFTDLSSTYGLDTLEEYFTKRQWIMFIKNFKDRFGIHESESVFDEVATPVASRSVEKELEKEDKAIEISLNKKGEVGSKPEEKVSEKNYDTVVSPVTGLLQSFAKLKLDDSLSEDSNINTTLDSGNIIKGDQEKLGDVIYKRITENNNAIEVESDNNKVDLDKEKDFKHTSSKTDVDEEKDSKHTDSRATLDKEKNSKPVDNKIGVNKEEDSKHTDSSATLDKEKNSKPVDNKIGVNKEEDSKHTDSSATLDKEKNSKPVDNKIGVNKEEDSKYPGEHNGTQHDKELKGCENVGVVDNTNQLDQNKLETDQKHTSELKDGEDVGNTSSPVSDTSDGVRRNIPFTRFSSEGSESVSSYETAVDEVHDSSLSYVSESSEPPEVPACINLKDRNVFDRIRKFLCKGKNGETVSDGARANSNTIRLIVRLIPVSSDRGMTVDIASIPEIDTVKDLLLFENVEVSSCTGDVSSVLDGEEVELGVEGGVTEEDAGLMIQAYLTRSSTLPKFGYIHGTQPTREDLDVCRALSDCVITPTSHPKVFSWKIGMAKFLKDTNFKWQSPAKLKSSLRQTVSPQPVTARGTSPVINYGSPLGLSARAARDIASSDIRTRLFPSIKE